jgi:hypothetical protein
LYFFQSRNLSIYRNAVTGTAEGVPVKLRIVNELREKHTGTDLCSELGVSRSGFYAYVKRQEVDRDEPVKQLILTIYQKYDGKYGYRQIQMHLLRDYGVLVNHKKVLRLMQELGIRSRIRRKRRSVSESTVGGRVVENLLKRDFHADKPNQKWVTDVTSFAHLHRLQSFSTGHKSSICNRMGPNFRSMLLLHFFLLFTAGVARLEFVQQIRPDFWNVDNCCKLL